MVDKTSLCPKGSKCVEKPEEVLMDSSTGLVRTSVREDI